MLEEYKQKQPIAFNIMKNAIDNQEYSHAYLIETNHYHDAYRLILSFVKNIFSMNDAKLYSYISQAIDDNNYPELRIISPDGSWIKKEQLLKLQDEFNKKALTGNKKIYIIKDADRLNAVAANSILKFLEEPQPNIIAILMCDNRQRLLETISSRCQIISLINHYNEDFDNYYSKIGQLITSTNQELETFLSDENNKLKIDASLEFIRYFEKNGKKTLLFMNKYWYNTINTKEDYELALETILYFYLDVLNKKLSKSLVVFNEIEKNLSNCANENQVIDLARKIDNVKKTLQKLEYNANLNLLMDKLIIEMDGCI